MSKQPLQEDTMTEEREEFMVPPIGEETPKLRRAHFLKPTINPRNQPIPKLASLSLSSNPNIKQLTKMVTFKGRAVPQKKWDIWVESLQQAHQETWKIVGIFDAIRASTYVIKRHNELIIELTQNWCPETNTFVFPWGECTITLEDVMILGGFSVMGVSVLSPSQSKEIEEIENNFVNDFHDIRRKSHGVSHYVWMDYFMGIGGDLENMALIALWLSRYVFSTNSSCYISPCAFPIAISLARGTRIALAPAVLAAIYRELSLLKEKIVGFVGEGGDDSSKLVLWAPFQLVQLWVWERFPKLGPEPVSLLPGEPRLARWQNLRKPKNGCLRLEFESLGESFVWRPYALFVMNWEFPEFYCDEERWVVINSEVREELLAFARCLRACELVGLNFVEQYLPHRVGMQFGMDQDLPGSIPISNGSIELAWSCYDVPLHGVKLYLSSRLLKGLVTVRYYHWWKKAIRLCSLSRVSVLEQPRISLRSMKKPSVNLDGTTNDIEMQCFCSFCYVSDSNVKPSSSSFVKIVSASCDHPSESHVENYKGMSSKSPQNVVDEIIMEINSAMEPLEECWVEDVDTQDHNEFSSKKPSPGLDGTIDDMETRYLCNVNDVVPSSSSNIVKVVTETHFEIPPHCDENNHPSESQVENYEGISCESPHDVVNEVVREINSAAEDVETKAHNESLPAHIQAVNKVKSVMGAEMKKACPMAVDDEEAKGLEDAETQSHIQALNEVQPVMEPEMKLSLMNVDDEQVKGSEDENVKQVNGLSDETLIIIKDDDDEEEEEENGDFNPFEELGSELEARINELEKVVSRLTAAKLGSKVK